MDYEYYVSLMIWLDSECRREAQTTLMCLCDSPTSGTTCGLLAIRRVPISPASHSKASAAEPSLLENCSIFWDERSHHPEQDS